MEELLFYLNSIHPLSPRMQEHFIQIVQYTELRKRDILLRRGQVCENIYFILKGILRCYYVKNDNEVSSWFMKEGDLIVSVESYFLQKPSYEYIQALDDCILYSVSHSQLEAAYREFPEMNFISRVFLEKYYTLSEQRIYSIRMQRASERYQLMLEHHPEIIQRVAAKHIASYLGITMETLSRLKSKY